MSDKQGCPFCGAAPDTIGSEFYKCGTYFTETEPQGDRTKGCLEAELADLKSLVRDAVPVVEWVQGIDCLGGINLDLPGIPESEKTMFKQAQVLLARLEAALKEKP